jgi:hypothetical protein
LGKTIQGIKCSADILSNVTNPAPRGAASATKRDNDRKMYGRKIFTASRHAMVSILLMMPRPIFPSFIFLSLLLFKQLKVAKLKQVFLTVLPQSFCFSTLT